MIAWSDPKRKSLQPRRENMLSVVSPSTSLLALSTSLLACWRPVGVPYLLVRSFQDYFDSLKGTIDFEWDHAKRAEPRELCKKVKAKMEGKNLFIGIFTKKDFRIAPDKLEASEAPEKKCLSYDDLTWVPSNWIIQESGYALGKDMDVIFAVENGVDLQTKQSWPVLYED
jgi:hypothetical protein